MRISYNASAAIATNQLNRNDNRLQQSLGRLSSGLKIVNAKDNPSGLAMSKRMNAQIKGISQATQNASDGVSIIEIADGSLSEIHDMLQRINELSVKSNTGILTDDDRRLINAEVQQLKEEITRISAETEFNGQKLLDGSFDLKGYTDQENVKVTYYSDAIKSGTYNVSLTGIVFNADGTIEEVGGVAGGPAFPDDVRVSQVDGNLVTIRGSQDFELKLHVEDDGTGAAQIDAILDLTGFGAMDMQVGANEGQQLGIRIPKVNLENIGISSIDLSTEEGSADALGRMDQNRLEHTISSLDISNESMTSAYSRIMDVDMAEEMTEYTTVQVLTQASTSMLAQANERPAQVLQLLQ